MDEQQKRDYVRDVREKQGIELDPASIERNEARRTIGKLACNAFWGKWGQKAAVTETRVMDMESDEFHTLIHDENREIVDMDILNEDKALVQYKARKEAVVSPPNSQIIVAVYTTGT